MQKAAARRAVMAGAEGEPGLDLDPDVILPHTRAIVRAVNEKPPGAHRLEAGQRIGDPVALLRQPERRRTRRLLVGRRPRSARGSPPHPARIQNRPRPATPAAARPKLLRLERARSDFRRLEALDDEIGDRAGALFVRDERQAIGRVVGRQAFEHRDSSKPFSRLREKVGARSATDEGSAPLNAR